MDGVRCGDAAGRRIGRVCPVNHNRLECAGHVTRWRASVGLFGGRRWRASIVDEVALKAYRDILARDPKNTHAAVSAGNMLYDAKRYEDAIPFYQQAMAANRADVSVSTDLGTALWYSGRADAALAQYAVSLTIDPNHAQTLFNMGVVRSDGKKDYAGAAEAWEALLAKNAGYQNAANVRSMIADAKGKAAQ